MKKILLIISCMFLLSACMITDTSEKNTEISSDTVNINSYTDPETGISLSTPINWVINTDENGNLYTYRQNPYSTVSFEVSESRESWQKLIDDFKQGSDTLIKEEDTIIGGYSTLILTFDRLEQFQYSEYFVDGEDKWYHISSSDPNSDEINQIIQSISFN